MQKIKLILIGLCCLLIPGCGSNSLDYYEKRKHKIDLRHFFQGNIEGWGGIFDFTGKQTRSFYVKIKGTWQENKGRLEERFDFDDGEVTERIWDISFVDGKIFTASAHDVTGLAKGKQNGNAVNMSYTLNVPYNNSTLALKMDDWMYLVAEDVILNRTSMKKFGFKVAEVVLFMKKSAHE
jgi:Protein of unknown function (DUF3833)